MALPPRQPETPTQKAIEKALSRLCTKGLRTYWILDMGRFLLGFDCVRAYLDESTADEVDYARALRRYLDGAVGRIESRQHRIVLEVVLGIGEDRWSSKAWRNQTAQARREEAGRRFRGSEGAVTFGTIRQHHEPRAVRELAAIVWADEKAARNEPSSEEHPEAVRA